MIYPGLPSHRQHALAVRQMNGFGGMVTAESLGGTDSLIEHPAIMTHATIPPEQRRAIGIGDSLVRLSVGIEDAGDLIADLDQALRRLRSPL